MILILFSPPDYRKKLSIIFNNDASEKHFRKQKNLNFFAEVLSSPTTYLNLYNTHRLDLVKSRKKLEVGISGVALSFQENIWLRHMKR